MSDNRIESGRRGEILAWEYLQNRGYKLITRNYRFRRGEIDLIVESPEGDLVFVEVKTSHGNQAGEPEEWVTPRKQRQIQRVAQGYCLGLEAERAMRFDVVGVDLDAPALSEKSVRHIPNAFLPDAMGYFR